MTHSSARDAVLGRIRASLGREALDSATAAALDTRIATPPRHTRPAQSGELLDLFVRRFEQHSGSVERIAARDAMPATVREFLDAHQLPPRIVIGGALTDLAWASAGIEAEARRAYQTDVVSASSSRLAIAELGCLLFVSGTASPATHNYVPDYQIALLDARTVVLHIEDAWAWLRAQPGGMPRTVNLVYGPSRTGDIEQTIKLGAHGPKGVHVLIYEA